MMVAFMLENSRMRPLSELICPQDSALPLVREWIAASPFACEILPPHAERDRVLSALQVTTRSTMGALAWETGGLLVQDGWLRILGSGHAKLSRNIVDWNAGRSSGLLLIADDVAGGFFAVNGGALGSETGTVHYLEPDTLDWFALGLGYSDFVQWALSKNLDEFYAGLRWRDWQSDLAAVGGDACFTFYPFLWTAEGSTHSSNRRVITADEQYRLNLDLMNQLHDAKR